MSIKRDEKTHYYNLSVYMKWQKKDLAEALVEQMNSWDLLKTQRDASEAEAYRLKERIVDLESTINRMKKNMEMDMANLAIHRPLNFEQICQLFAVANCKRHDR